MTEPDPKTKYPTAFPKLDDEQLAVIAKFAEHKTYMDSSVCLL